MIGGTGIDAFEQQFADFNHRVTALRAAREDSPDVLDAVFLELELAQEELRVMRRYQRRSDTATALRASVLPRGPVQIPGLDWAAAYRVGTEGAEVGGDFYDLFRSPGSWGRGPR